MMRGTVFVFVKAPRAGAVKTRLGRSVGMGRAAALFRIMTERTIHEVGRGGWRAVLAVDPPSSVFEGQRALWPSRFERVAQGQGDLGARMGRVIAGAPRGPAIVVGADAPGFRARHLRAAFASLKGADAVFGPAADGGFWLIGLARRRPAPGLFERVRWSTPYALADTVESLPKDYDVRFLETLRDVDEAADLGALGLRTRAR